MGSSSSGRWVERTAARAERHALFSLLSGLALTLGVITLLFSGGAAPIAAVPLLGLLLLARRYLDLQLDIAGMKRRGADAEAAVRAELDALITEGYVVLHGLESVMPGDVDHLVSGPTGVCLIETKSRTFGRKDLRRTKEAAARVAPEVGVRFVIPVICLHRRPNVLWRQEKVDVVGIERLADFIRSRRQMPGDIDGLTRLAGRG